VDHTAEPSATLADGRGSILVVEDEILVRMGVVEDLLEAGYAVLEASTADEAIALLDGGAEVDLVFSDIQMPGAHDGVALLRVVRERFPALPVILTSGRLKPPREALAGDTLFVPKPYFPGELLRMVERAIEGGRSVAAETT
jgi:CheY-like chemotaxis protein